MKFKNSIAVLFACSSLAGLTSCDNVDYNAVDADKVAVSFVPQIGETATRAVNQTWSAGDKVGIAMVAAGQALPTGSTFKQYQVSGAGASVSLAPVADAQTLFYPTDGSDVNFIAFSPVATVTNNTITYTGLADQSTQAKMEAVDFLYHKGTTAYNRTGGAATLAFGHKLSKLVINVATSTGADKVTLSGLDLKINDTPAAVTANLADGSITAGAKAAITPYLTGTTTRAATAILVPHAATAGRSITFTVTEGTYTYTIPSDDDFEANKVYTLDFNLTRNGVALSGTTINGWNNGGSGSPIDGKI